MTALSLALSLVLAAPDVPTAAESDAIVRGRAWKISLAGGATALVGVGFLVAGTVLLAREPTGDALNTAHAFQVGGVMLTCVGVLLAALSVPMWLWHTTPTASAPAVAFSVGPGSLRVTW